MGIADFFRPKFRHSDVRVRTEAVKAMTRDDAATLILVARSDRDIGVRRIAMEKIDQADVLADLATAESERSLRDFAGERAAQLWHSAACSDDPDRANNALSGIIKLGEQRSLVEVIVGASLATIRKRAFGELRDPRALAALAKSEAVQDIRIAAVGRIDDGDVLRALAIDTTLKEVGLAAVERLDDVDRLENVASKAKNKAVRQKARKIVGEIVEAEKAKKTPAVPDEVKRKRAERAQLLREVEAVAETFDFAKISEQIKKAEAAWAELGDDGDVDQRFSKAVARFWKRKEIYESQARSADELRAIEREAARARASAEPKPEPTQRTPIPAEPAPDDYVRELVPDAKREARDAEAKARREEREKFRAEEDARRAAQQADREARQKEDAERGVQIAESLRAMVTDMEGLAANDKSDMKAIDRLLSQSGKAFDQIGKVPPAERDSLADRYRDVRGKLVARVAEVREAEDWQRWTNVPKAEALIATAKELFEAEPPPSDLGNRLRGLQALWKEVGPMPQRRSKELWDSFKTACDQLYEKVRGQRAVDDVKFADVTKVKEALIAEAEALAESTDWATTADKLKNLQGQWKTSGHLPRKQGDELWKRFRTACDKFFERRKPMLDARQAEEGDNLRRKQALIERAQQVARKAPDDGGWGKAIGQIKDLQREWKDIGFVPRREADAVYKAFRTACDSLFAKRDEARDGEANAHRAEIDALKAELASIVAGGDDVVTRAIALRAKAAEHDALTPDILAMVRHVVTHHAEAIKGTELDPAQLRAKREKLIARAEELLPKQAPAPAGDVAAQLKAAMGRNAFGDLRFSGRDPIEVLEDLKHEWNLVGPILDATDDALAERFEAMIGRVLEAYGRKGSGRASREDGRAEDDGATDPEGDGRRRRRRDRRDESAAPVAVPVGLDTAASALRSSPVPVAIPVGLDTAAAALRGSAPVEIPTSNTVPMGVPLPPREATAAVPRAVPTSVDTAPLHPTPTAVPKKSEAAINIETRPMPALVRPPADSAPAPLPPIESVPVASPTPVHDMITAPAQIPSLHSPVAPEVPTLKAPEPMPAPAPTPPPAAAVPVLVAVAASSPAPMVVEDAVTKPAAVPALRPPVEHLPPPPGAEAARARTTSTPPMDDVDGGWDLGDDDPTAGQVEETSTSTPSSLEMAGDGAAEGDGLDSVD